MYQINKRKIKQGVGFNILALSLSLCFCLGSSAFTGMLDKDDEKLDRQIKDRVSIKVSEAMRKKRREQMKDILYPDDLQRQIKKLSSPFKLPNWPFYSMFYDQRDLAQIAFSGSFASESLNSNGRSKDITDLVFKLGSCQCIQIQDILLVSKLALAGLVFNSTAGCTPSGTAGVVAPPDATDLAALATQKLLFDGSVTRLDCSLNFARHFLDGRLSFGCMIPFVYRHNKLKLKNCDLDPAIKAAINAPYSVTIGTTTIPVERTFAGMSLQEIFALILKSKGIDWCKGGKTETGIGDVTTFLHYDIDSKLFERFIVGLAGIFPTARDADVSRLWDATTGNGGFYQMRFFSSMLWNGKRFFNPHFHCSATYSFPGSLYKPVPKRVIYDGILANRNGRVIPNDLMELADNVILKNGVPFNTLDVCIGNFARTCKKIRFSPGAEFFFKLGNIFEGIINSRGFLDVYYDLTLRGKDYLGDRKCIDNLDPRFWTRRTWQVAHRIGVDFSYQFDHQVRLFVGGLFTAAGRNIEKTYEGHIKLNIEF